jgi:hypothetical protein
MTYNKELIAGKLRRWEKYLEDYRLPAWEEIPDFGLYMDQVVTLLTEYLDYMPPELKEEQIITPAAINNYVRKKIMPEPIKKKYYRVHIAYLIMVCTLKQSLSIQMLRSMIPMGLNGEELRRVYGAFVKRHRLACAYFLKQVRIAAGGILDHGAEEETEITTDDTNDLISSMAVISGFARLLAEKLLLLEGKDLTNGGSVELRGLLKESGEQT